MKVIKNVQLSDEIFVNINPTSSLIQGTLTRPDLMKFGYTIFDRLQYFSAHWVCKVKVGDILI